MRDVANGRFGVLWDAWGEEAVLYWLKSVVTGVNVERFKRVEKR